MYVLMIICAAGMIYGHVKYNTKSVVWGRPLSGLCGIAAVCLAVAKISMVATEPARKRSMIISTDLQYAAVGMEYLGNYLATNFPGREILLITRPVTPEFSAMNKAMMKGFADGLDGRLTIAAQKEPPRTVAELMAGTKASDEFTFTATQFDQLLKLYPNCNLIVSLIGLPKDLEKMKFWTMEASQRPKVCLAFADIYELKSAISLGFVSAAMVFNRDYRLRPDEPVPNDLSAAFAKRYKLVTAENIGQLAAANPRMFKPEVADKEGEE